jgi:hypothetical protein
MHTSSGTHPTLYSMGAGGSFPGIKMTGVRSSLRSSAKAKNEWSYASTPPRAIMASTETTLPYLAQ